MAVAGERPGGRQVTQEREQTDAPQRQARWLRVYEARRSAAAGKGTIAAPGVANGRSRHGEKQQRCHLRSRFCTRTRALRVMVPARSNGKRRKHSDVPPCYIYILFIHLRESQTHMCTIVVCIVKMRHREQICL